MWFKRKAPVARRLRAARPFRRPAARGRGLRRGHPPGNPRALGPRRLDQRGLHDARSARGQGAAAIVGRRADRAARRPPPEVLRAAPGRRGGAAPGLPRLHRDDASASKAGWRPSERTVRRALAVCAARPPPVRRVARLRRRRSRRRIPRRAAPCRRSAARRWFWWQTIRCLRRAAAAVRPASTSIAVVPQEIPCVRTLAADFRYSLRVLRRARRRSRSPSSPCWRSASAPTPRSSASSTRCCCGRCRSSEPDRLVRLFHVPPQATFPGMPTLLGLAGELLRLAARRAVVRADGAVPLPRRSR